MVVFAIALCLSNAFYHAFGEMVNEKGGEKNGREEIKYFPSPAG